MKSIAKDPRLAKAVAAALDEDVGAGDATTIALVDPKAVVEGEILTREDCVVAGVDVAKAVFAAVSSKIKCRVVVADGARAKAGENILTFKGPASAILTAERVALNFMQRMCGVATATSKFVEAVRSHKTMILDTRKTTPGLRFLEKYSVVCGGGTNHRMGLYDRVMIKDNHRMLWKGGNPNALDEAVYASRRRFPKLAVEVEVESLEEFRSAVKAKPEWILLDNMPCAMMKKAVAIPHEGTLLEASGGITMKNVRKVAETGVDAISFGCLTHHVKSIDLSLEWRQAAKGKAR